MANDDHIAQLKKGVAAWNAWRDGNRNILPDLSGAKLSKADLRGANLTEANLSKAGLREADLSGADLTWASLSETDLSGADLFEAKLYGAKLLMASLPGANLRRADLSGADLSGANLIEANLTAATLVETDLTDADLTGCSVYGISAWGLKSERAKQHNLVITRGRELAYHISPGDRWIQEPEPAFTVDNIKVAQFIYLMLNNQEIRDVIDTITSKVVLILGRFTNERKAVLDALREELRKRDYLPILFDFDVPTMLLHNDVVAD
jgi:hypothetical protein